MDKVQHFSFLYLHAKEPVCDRQHQTAAQSFSGGTVGNDRENPGGVRVLHLLLSWLVYRDVYYIFWDF